MYISITLHIIYIYIYIYICINTYLYYFISFISFAMLKSKNQIMHDNLCFNLLMLHNN